MVPSLANASTANDVNKLVENNPTASGYPSGKATIPEQSSRASLGSSLSTLPENMTGLEYLDQLKARKDVNWQAVELAHDRWSYHQEGLTPAGAALLSIAVASVTGGMGAELLGGTAATATSGATLMGSTALATAVNAGFSALAAQAAVAMVNNQGDIGKTLEQLGKEESIKNLALTMATAGALDKLGGSMGWNQINAKSDFIDQLQKNLGNNIATDMINSALDGKPFNEESLQRSLSNALITSGMAYGANAIGDAYSGKDGIPPSLNDFTHKLAHAVLGCAGGAASQGSMQGCAPGAVGAVVGELTAEYAKDKNWSNEDALALAKTLSAVSGVLVGGGGSNAQAVNTAATTGGNAAQNNFLGHVQKLEQEALRKKAARPGGLTKEESARLVYLDATDQMSDGLLNKYRNGKALTADEQKNLSVYITSYTQQNGESATQALLQLGPKPDYDYPYAGTAEMQRAYARKMSLMQWLVGHAKSSNEEAFTTARVDAGLYLNTAPNELFLPTNIEYAKNNATIDALLNSPVLATATYLAGKALGTNPDTLSAATQTASVVSDVGSSLVLPKTALSPVLGETIVGAINVVDNGVPAVNPEAVATLKRNGIKFTEENLVLTTSLPNGQIVFLEKGKGSAGFVHILQEHGDDFLKIGVSADQIPAVLSQAINGGVIVGYQGKDTGRPIFQTTVNGRLQNIAISIGSNGFIVGANPAGGVK